MTTPFAELEKIASDTIDDHMGEPTRIVRKVAGQYFSRSADGSRPPLEVVGIVDFNPVVARPKDQGQYDGYQPELSGDRIIVSYATTRFASRTDWPAKDDEIELLDPDRAGMKLRVTRPDPDGLGRLVCACVLA
jgi:hypothetical protein